MKFEENMALIVIDFDNTIANGHTFNIIHQAISRDNSIVKHPEKQWELIKHIPAIIFSDGHETITWKELFEQMVQEGHQIGIASFSSYGMNTIAHYLKEVVGLSEEFIKNNIVIKSWLPDKPSESDKNTHIMQVKNECLTKNEMLRYRLSEIILVDDSTNNVMAANARGFSVVKAPDAVDSLSPSSATHLHILKHQVLPLFKQPGKLYDQFVQNQKRGPHGLEFGISLTTIDIGISIADNQDETQQNSNDAKSQDVLFIAATNSTDIINQFAKKISNGFLITTDHQLYTVENSTPTLCAHNVKNNIIGWLKEHGYQEYMQAAHSQPVSMLDIVINNSTANLQLAMLTIPPTPSITSASLFNEQSSSNTTNTSDKKNTNTNASFDPT